MPIRRLAAAFLIVATALAFGGTQGIVAQSSSMMRCVLLPRRQSCQRASTSRARCTAVSLATRPRFASATAPAAVEISVRSASGAFASIPSTAERSRANCISLRVSSKHP